nr:hypothetical protein [uncultured Moellerella sp.]
MTDNTDNTPLKMTDKMITPYIKCDEIGYIDAENGYAYIGFQFPITPLETTDKIFMGLELNEIKELVEMLQDHLERHPVEEKEFELVEEIEITE